MPAITLSALLLLGPGQLRAQVSPDAFVTVELWAELDPLVDAMAGTPVTREVAVNRLLDEAQATISGLVYGYRFSYTPGDPAREIDEEFHLEPYARIIRGDPRLDVVQTWVEDTNLYARVTYSLDPAQIPWFTGWHSSAHARSSGVGRVSVMGGPTVKVEALADGIRMAIRNYARRIEFNRPASIAGAVILADAPRYGVQDGNYEALVTVYLQIDSIVPFRNY